MALFVEKILHDEATSISNGLDLDVKDIGWILIVIKATATASTIVFKGKVESDLGFESDWSNISALDMDADELTGLVSTATDKTNSKYIIDATAVDQIRCDLTAVSGGNVTVFARQVV